MPPYVRLHAVDAVFAVPTLFKARLQVVEGDVHEHDTTLAETFAVLVNDPKRPKTKPATAMAAMSVIAMRMTVARTGEMAFLFLPCCTIFIVGPEKV
jgi:hypothetical protein